MPPTVAYLMCDTPTQRVLVDAQYRWLIRRSVQLASMHKWMKLMMPYVRLFG